MEGEMETNMENLPEHLLLDILALVPASDLICNCRLVCRQWRDLVDLPVLWKRKYQEKDNDPSPGPLDFYILSRLKKNLIKNPDGLDGLDSWEIQTPAEGHWETEELSVEDLKCTRAEIGPYERVYFWEMPAYVEEAPVEIYRCFAARNGPCSKSQLITLKDEGYWDELMDEARPRIVVKDCFSTKPGSRYKLTVKLLSVDSEVLEEHQYDGAGSSYWFSEVSHTFCNYPQGVRHILFEHKGQKEVYHPNHLKFLFPEEDPREDREPSWGGVRVLQSSITLHPPSRTQVDDNYYGEYEDYYHDPHISSDESACGFFDSGHGYDSWYNDNWPPPCCSVCPAFLREKTRRSGCLASCKHARLGEAPGHPKPFGPIIHGQCCLEEKVRSLLEPLGLNCTFIDDFFSYHILSGEVHCGTNVLREPFSFHWWNATP